MQYKFSYLVHEMVSNFDVCFCLTNALLIYNLVKTKAGMYKKDGKYYFLNIIFRSHTLNFYIGKHTKKDGFVIVMFNAQNINCKSD